MKNLIVVTVMILLVMEVVMVDVAMQMMVMIMIICSDGDNGDVVCNDYAENISKITKVMMMMVTKA